MPTKARWEQMTPDQKARQAAYQRDRRKADPESARAYDAAYRVRRKDHINARQRQFYAAHQDKRRAQAKGYALRNKDRIASYQTRYKATNKPKIRLGEIQRVYGLSPEAYTVLFEQQDGKCALCRKEETAIHRKSGQVKNLHVDHSHATGHTRGLLCQKCNLAIGLLNDDPEIFIRAVAYLRGESNNARRAAGTFPRWERGKAGIQTRDARRSVPAGGVA